MPAPALCDQWRLANRQSEWDFYDELGQSASIYREFKDDTDTFRSHLAYARADLLKQYLAETGQSFIWVISGERDFHHRTALALRDELQDLYAERRDRYGQRVVWDPDSPAETLE